MVQARYNLEAIVIGRTSSTLVPLGLGMRVTSRCGKFLCQQPLASTSDRSWRRRSHTTEGHCLKAAVFQASMPAAVEPELQVMRISLCSSSDGKTKGKEMRYRPYLFQKHPRKEEPDRRTHCTFCPILLQLSGEEHLVRRGARKVL